MFSEGYRPRGGEQHATVVAFARERLGPAYKDQVQLFDQMRRKRHRVIYDMAGLVSTTEGKQAVEFAQAFVETITVITTGRAG